MQCKNSLKVLTLSALLAMVVSCAPTYKKADIDMAWPLPPDEPKIKYVETIRSTLDVGMKTGMADALFGEEKAQGMTKPYGVAVDGKGVIYVTDPGRVFVFDMNNSSYGFIGMDPGQGKLALPIGIAISADGRIFVTDVSQDRVFVYRERKYIAAIGEKGDLDGPSGVAVDDTRGLVYVTDAKKHYVKVYSSKDYSSVRTIGTRGSETGQFNYPTNITVDTEGKVYVVDSGNFRVQIFDAEGKFLRAIGKLGDMPGSLARPKGIAVDSEGHIYVVDTAFANFQIFDREGTLLLAVGGHGDPPGRFWLPAGMAVDHQDRIYVVDQYPGLVQVFQYMGEKWKKAGAASEGQGLKEKALEKK